MAFTLLASAVQEAILKKKKKVDSEGQFSTPTTANTC